MFDRNALALYFKHAQRWLTGQTQRTQRALAAMDESMEYIWADKAPAFSAAFKDYILHCDWDAPKAYDSAEERIIKAADIWGREYALSRVDEAIKDTDRGAENPLHKKLLTLRGSLLLTAMRMALYEGDRGAFEKWNDRFVQHNDSYALCDYPAWEKVFDRAKEVDPFLALSMAAPFVQQDGPFAQKVAEAGIFHSIALAEKAIDDRNEGAFLKAHEAFLHFEIMIPAAKALVWKDWFTVVEEWDPALAAEMTEAVARSGQDATALGATARSKGHALRSSAQGLVP